MKKIIYLALICLVILGCEKKEEVNEFIPYAIGDEISLKGSNGGERILKRVEGGFVVKGQEDKILLLDIFGTFCLPCQEEAPSLTKFQIENQDKFVLIGLTQFEDVTDEYIVDNFIKKYNAYYFISNSKDNERILLSILQDINYESDVQLPFKVMLKNGKYQTVTDVWYGRENIKFYLGKISTNTIKEDFEKIFK